MALNTKGEVFAWGKGEYSKNIDENLIPTLAECVTPRKLEFKPPPLRVLK
jgi:hypothetical protein